MAATQQPPSARAQAGGAAQACAACGAPLAPDQRYCLRCGTRRGEPRVAPEAPGREVAVAAAVPDQRPADVSPLAAVIGIALLGGMLLIGVLIGRGAEDDAPPAPTVQLEPSSSSAGTGSSTGTESSTEGEEAVASEWPSDTDGFTIQLTAIPKEGANAYTVSVAKDQAVADGAIDAAVLDSDLYASLPPGNYVIYSGVYTDRESAEVAFKGLRRSFPDAAVVEVSTGGSGGNEGSSDDAGSDDASPGKAGVDSGAITPGIGGESEAAIDPNAN